MDPKLKAFILELKEMGVKQMSWTPNGAGVNIQSVEFFEPAPKATSAEEFQKALQAGEVAMPSDEQILMWSTDEEIVGT